MVALLGIPGLGTGELVICSILLAPVVLVVVLVVVLLNRSQANKQVNRAAPMTAGYQPEPPSLQQQLGELARLRDESLISEEDYEAKKRQLLGI